MTFMRNTKKRLGVIILILLVTLITLTLIAIPQAQADEDELHVDFDILTQTGVISGDYGEVFYEDKLILSSNVYDPHGDDIERYEWTFEGNDTGSDIVTNDSREGFSFTVGVDHLYSYEDGGEPWMPDYNSNPVDYIVTLQAWDSRGDTGEHSVDVKVFPYAFASYTHSFRIDDYIVEAEAGLVWRGLEEEAAPDASHIGPERPVFVFMNETSLPDENMTTKGIVSNIFDIDVIGCTLQDGGEGFIEAELYLPFLMSTMDELGDAFMLSDELRLEYYDEGEGKFLVVDGSHREANQGVQYAVGIVHQSGLYAGIVDSVYNRSHPKYNDTLPDLSVQDVELSRAPALDGQEVEIRAVIRNTGYTHVRNVTVSFHDNDVFLGNQTVDVVRAEDITEVTKTFNMSMLDPTNHLESHTINVTVNRGHEIEEKPGTYMNNYDEHIMEVITSANPHLTVNITAPEDGVMVNGTVDITGTSTIGLIDSTWSTVEQPTGNNDWKYVVVSVDSPAPSVFIMSYYLIDDRGVSVPGVQGMVADIYGLDIYDKYTNVSFHDNDRDGKMSAGDDFYLKNAVNGGQWQPGYKLQLNISQAETVEKVEISVNNGTWMPAAGTGDWSYAFDSTTAENGNASVRFRAFDGVTYSAIRVLTLNVSNPDENIKPTLTITSPENGAKLSGKVAINGTASDEDGTVEKVEVAINDGDWQAVTGITSWSFEWDTKKLKNGEYQIKVRCYDGEDHSDIVTITVTVENEEDGDEEAGYLPGFEVMLLALVLLGWLGITQKKSHT